MKISPIELLFLAGMAIGDGPVLAHHSLNQDFDLMKSITVSGVITRVDWSNPHVRLYLDTNGLDLSDVMHWQLEMSSPGQLILHGIRTDNLRRGDRITVTAHPARHGSNLGYAETVSLAK